MTRIEPGDPSRQAPAVKGVKGAAPNRGPREPTSRPGATSTQGASLPGPATPAGQLAAAIAIRLRATGQAGPLADDVLLSLLVQESLAATFGPEISAHPRFDEIHARIRTVLLRIPALGSTLDALREELRHP